jgi:BASS family bile acid:Na+ symporter
LATLHAFLTWCARHGGALLAVCVFVGVAVPPLAALLREALTPAVAAMMTLVLLRMDLGQVVSYLRRPVLVAAMLAWLLLACPLIAWGFARLVGLDGPLGAALVIMATGAAATTSPAFARLVGLDASIALVVSLLSTLLLPLTAPPLAVGLLGIELPISMQGLMARLGLIVGLPTLIAIVIGRITPRERLQRASGAIDGCVVLLLVVYGIGVMDGIQAKLWEDPAWVAGGLALALLGNFGLNAISALALLPAGRRLALGMGLMSGNRNMSLYLAVLPATTEPRILLFFALCQFPLFLSSFLLRPVYARLAGGGASGPA